MLCTSLEDKLFAQLRKIRQFGYIDPNIFWLEDKKKNESYKMDKFKKKKKGRTEKKNLNLTYNKR